MIAKKEAKRLERLAKAALKSSTPTPAASGAKKEKKEKEKKEAAPIEQWVNTTPPGEKKGMSKRWLRGPVLTIRRFR